MKPFRDADTLRYFATRVSTGPFCFLAVVDGHTWRSEYAVQVLFPLRKLEVIMVPVR